jgi:hypothetical protein
VPWCTHSMQFHCSSLSSSCPHLKLLDENAGVMAVRIAARRGSLSLAVNRLWVLDTCIMIVRLDSSGATHLQQCTCLLRTCSNAHNGATYFSDTLGPPFKIFIAASPSITRANCKTEKGCLPGMHTPANAF